MRIITLLLIASSFLLYGCSQVPGDAAFRGGHYEAAFKLYEDEYRRNSNLNAGFRLADMYDKGHGVPLDKAAAFRIYLELAEHNIASAWHNLGVCYEYGEGTNQNYALAETWYRKAANADYLWSIYNLGTLYANNRISPPNNIEGLMWLLVATEAVKGNGPTEKFIRNDEPGHVKRLMMRMSQEQIAEARTLAAQKLKSIHVTR